MTRLYRMARWCWRCLPQEFRYSLYRQVSADPRVRGALPWPPIHRLAVHLYAKLTFRNARLTTREYWPELRGRDYFAAVVGLALLRYHTQFLLLAWRLAPLLRRRRPALSTASQQLSVMHVTSSFDLGGTQTQILNLCQAKGTKHDHATTEIFPELNFLFRRGESIDATRYVKGGLVARAMGRFAADFRMRSPQLVQTYKLVRDFQGAHPDVVVGWGHELCASTFLAASLARVPAIVFCIRTFNPAYGWVTEDMGRLLRVAHRVMTPHVAAVISNSTALRDDHTRWLGFSPPNLHVCPNGIDVSRLTDSEVADRRRRVRQELGLAEDVCVVVNVGRFSPEKGQHLLVDVNARLQPDFPPSRLAWLLCGDGPTLESVRARTQDLGMSNIIFVGRTGRVRDYLCAADVFVMPSDFEGMPNAMMEAMGCGLPCISTNRSGALDVARHGLEALYCDPGDVPQMEAHLRYLLEHREQARAMGRRAQERLREFSVARFVARFEHILDEATWGAVRDRTGTMNNACEQKVTETTGEGR